MRLRHCVITLAATAALAGGLTGCGGGSDSSTPSATATSTVTTPSSTSSETQTSSTTTTTATTTTATTTSAAPTGTTGSSEITTGAPTTPVPPKTLTTPPPANDSKAANPSAALEAAVRSYSGFYTGGNGSAAYALLSARCQKLYSPSLFGAVVKQVHDGYGTTPIATLSVVVNGDSGFATYTYPKSGLNQNRQPWVLESGSWKNDGC